MKYICNKCKKEFVYDIKCTISDARTEYVFSDSQIRLIWDENKLIALCPACYEERENEPKLEKKYEKYVPAETDKSYCSDSFGISEEDMKKTKEIINRLSECIGDVSIWEHNK